MLTPKWVIHTAITVAITMVFIYIIKKVSIKYNVPVMRQVSEGI